MCYASELSGIIIIIAFSRDVCQCVDAKIQKLPVTLIGLTIVYVITHIDKDCKENIG